MSRRDEVWERKRELFQRRSAEDASLAGAPPGGCGGGAAERRRPAPLAGSGAAPPGGLGGGCEADVPTAASPLSRLIRDSDQPYGGRAAPAQHGFPPPMPQQTGRAPQPPTGGFDAGVAQQWSQDVTRNRLQQQNDPGYTGKYTRPQGGFRVSQAPGGGSSLSLAWQGDAAAPPAGPSGARARTPSPATAAARLQLGGGGAPEAHASYARSCSRDRPDLATAAYARGGSQDRQAGSQGGCGAGPDWPGAAARAGSRDGPPGGNLVREAAPPPAPWGQQAPGRVPSPRRGLAAPADQGYGLGFGAQAQERSSNAYATGSNQNVGNVVTDRRTTYVAQPPGGRSQISFG